MDKLEILEKLTVIFKDVLDDDDIVLELSTTASDVFNWDSLNHVRLMLSVESEFKVKLSALEISKLANVGNLVDLVANKLTKSSV